jgi:hypothetical protein
MGSATLLLTNYRQSRTNQAALRVGGALPGSRQGQRLAELEDCYSFEGTINPSDLKIRDWKISKVKL